MAATWAQWMVLAQGSTISGSPGTPALNAQQARVLHGVYMPADPTGTRPLGGLSGRRFGSWTVTLSGTTINVGPGVGVLDVETAANNGPYAVMSDGTDSTLAWTPADSTRWRADGVYVTVNDADASGDGSGSRTPGPTYVAGAPAASGSQQLPTTPARSLLVATINVPPSGSGSPSVTMSDLLLPNPSNPKNTYGSPLSGNGSDFVGSVYSTAQVWGPGARTITPTRNGYARVKCLLSVQQKVHGYNNFECFPAVNGAFSVDSGASGYYFPDMGANFDYGTTGNFFRLPVIVDFDPVYLTAGVPITFGIAYRTDTTSGTVTLLNYRWRIVQD